MLLLLMKNLDLSHILHFSQSYPLTQQKLLQLKNLMKLQFVKQVISKQRKIVRNLI
jgi:hypothetical protein